MSGTEQEQQRAADEIRDALRAAATPCACVEVRAEVRRLESVVDAARIAHGILSNHVAQLESAAYLVWSNEHRAWWRPNCAGYTIHSAAAGRYPRGEALSICRGARNGWNPDRAPDEVPVAERDLDEIDRAAPPAASNGE
ncbi:MAG: hypothetical protein JWM36_4377 [Hyphomicrobiales bacterium]|nr:hypothetical protein [Hyphomicrobiales bacterium]